MKRIEFLGNVYDVDDVKIKEDVIEIYGIALSDGVLKFNVIDEKGATYNVGFHNCDKSTIIISVYGRLLE